MVTFSPGSIMPLGGLKPSDCNRKPADTTLSVGTETRVLRLALLLAPLGSACWEETLAMSVTLPRRLEVFTVMLRVAMALTFRLLIRQVTLFPVMVTTPCGEVAWIFKTP